MTEIPDSAVYEARENEEAFEKLLRENSVHIKYQVYKATQRVVTESDDEWSIAMLAFWEAVESFDESKGSFVPFADVVIRRRVIDSIRQNARHGAEILVDPDESLSDVPSKETVEDMRVFEIEALSKVLSQYGIKFSDLSTCSPKSEKTRRACAMVVSTLLDNKEIVWSMRGKHELPIKKIGNICEVPRKIMERHRKYIIAAAEIMIDDYPNLSEYMGYIRNYRKSIGKS